MKLNELRDKGITTFGVYRIWWKDGGESVASVGQDDAGELWYVPSNWLLNRNYSTFCRVTGVGWDWDKVKCAKLLMNQKGDDGAIAELRRELCLISLQSSPLSA